MSMKQRRLWLEEGEDLDADTVLAADTQDDYESIFRRFSSKPEKKPLTSLVANSLVIGQEVVLTILVLVFHREIILEENWREEEGVHGDRSSRRLSCLALISVAFGFVFIQNKPPPIPTQSRRTKFQQRLSDEIFIAVLLRFLAAVLKTLTASYSSDTVHALAISCLILHLFVCDYSYANGLIQDPASFEYIKRPTFRGGTLSLTAAFFATTLLASRLESNASVYNFVSSSVILFALYPAARHNVSKRARTVRSCGKFNSG